MGIYDRDYMKRSPKDRNESRGSGGSSLEDFLAGVSGKYRKLLIGAGIAVGLLVVVLLVLTSG